MTITALIEEIQALPWAERLLVLEKTAESLRQSPATEWSGAAALLAADYRTDAELTAFTQLDAEPFYEAR